MAAAAPSKPDMEATVEAVEPSPVKATPKRQRKAKDKAAIIEEGADEEGGEPSTPKPKRTRKTKPKEPVVYVIPEVERKETTFKGRLGYACLNTILRDQKPPVFCSRTCRIDTIKKEGMAFLKDIGIANIKDLVTLVEWNAARGIFFMRMSSEMFPFASHAEYGFSLEYAKEELKHAGDVAKKLGVRLTTHPGQFTQLGSPRPQVVENAKRDLAYHAEMMDLMGLGPDSVMIIHGGGTYGDGAAALDRIRAVYPTLSQTIRNRLVLENDEMCYNVDALLPLCEDLNIPLVLDYHHDWIYPSSTSVAELMPRIIATWTRKGIKPKQHLSEPRPGAVTVPERRAHSDRCTTLPAALPDDMDLMIEAKDKEQAVFELFRIYGLHPVEHDDLRPPRPEGEESPKKKRGKKKEVALSDGLEEEAVVAEEGDEGEGSIALVTDVDRTTAVATPKKSRKPRAKKGTPVMEPPSFIPDTPLTPLEPACLVPPQADVVEPQSKGKGRKRKASGTETVKGKRQKATFAGKESEDDA